MFERIVSRTMLIMLFIGILTSNIQETFTQSETTLNVNPLTTHVSVNIDFSVNVTVADVADLFGFQFHLSYNSTLLDASTVIIQPPFEGFIRINETEGYVYAEGSLPIGYSSLYGNGPLSSITFKAVTSGSCTLHLYYTILFDSTSNPIAHTTMDGFVIVSSRIIVPDDYPTIQEAVNAASVGDVIYVYGPYYYSEDVIIDKSVSLIGLFGPRLASFNVVANNVYIQGFGFSTPWGFPYGRAIVLNGVSGCEILNVTVSGIDEGPGIVLTDASNNVIAHSEIWGFFWGGGIVFERSHNNTIFGNTIDASYESCIRLQDSLDNRFFHNQFYVYGGKQITIVGMSINVWDADYPYGGNCWNDYNGTDLFSGPHQNETGSDGVGDTPYIIDTNNTDHYPLMKPYPWGPHDVEVTHIARVYKFGPHAYVSPPKTIGFVNIQLHLDVFVMNYGDYPEVLNLTVYANSTVIGQVSNVTLAAKNSTILDMTWDTSGFAKGNYTISAYLEPVLGETDVEDNNYTDGKIRITIPGDVDGDGKVDMRDIAYVARRFGMSAADPRWNTDADINDDGKVDMKDLSVVAKNFGKHYP